MLHQDELSSPPSYAASSESPTMGIVPAPAAVMSPGSMPTQPMIFKVGSRFRLYDPSTNTLSAPIVEEGSPAHEHHGHHHHDHHHKHEHKHHRRTDSSDSDSPRTPKAPVAAVPPAAVVTPTQTAYIAAPAQPAYYPSSPSYYPSSGGVTVIDISAGNTVTNVTNTNIGGTQVIGGTPAAGGGAAGGKAPEVRKDDDCCSFCGNCICDCLRNSFCFIPRAVASFFSSCCKSISEACSVSSCEKCGSAICNCLSKACSTGVDAVVKLVTCSCGSPNGECCACLDGLGKIAGNISCPDMSCSCCDDVGKCLSCCADVLDDADKAARVVR